MVKRPALLLAIFLSLLLHLGLAILAVVGWQSKPDPRKTALPSYIKAELVQLKPKSKKKASVKKKPKKVDIAAKRREEQRKKKLADKKRKDALAKKKAEQKRKAEAAKKKKQKADAARAAERKRNQQQQMLQEFEQALLEEEGLLQEDEYATEAQSYVSLISQRVVQKWSRPPSARNGMRCELTITLVPNGRIIDVNIKKSSGNDAFDRSAIAAVKKVESFPEIKSMPIEVFERHFRIFSLGFQPEDLRQ